MKIAQKMAKSLSEVWKQTTSDSSVYLRDGVSKKAGLRATR